MASLSVTWSGRIAPVVALGSLRVSPRSPAPLWQPGTRSSLATARRSTRYKAAGGNGASSAPEEDLDAEFRSLLARLEAWKERYYDCIVPRKVHDDGELGEWVHRLRALRKRGRLAPAAVAALDTTGFAWEVDVLAAKWCHNLHAARRYKEVHGTGDLPPGLSSDDADWVEASRWLERQRDLYKRQKLPLLRVRLLKEVLGVKLEREHARPRRNMHAVLRQQNAQFRREMRRRQEAGGRSAEAAGRSAAEGQRASAGR